MPANDFLKAQTRPVMAVWRRAADAPERRGPPLLDEAAIELHLVERLADIVVLEVAVDAADRVGAAAGDEERRGDRAPGGRGEKQLTKALSPHRPVARSPCRSVRQHHQLTFEPIALVIPRHLQLEETAVAVVAFGVIP